MTPPRVTNSQRRELRRVAQHETPEFGLIIHEQIAEALIRKGLAVSASRRRYARVGGYCVRLTEAGRDYARGEI